MSVGLIILLASMLILAALPAAMTFANLRLLQRPALPALAPRISILIPARNEEDAIAGCINAARASTHAEIEIIVMDDGSTDRTADIVHSISTADARVRLEHAPPLPPGWNGKQHACHVLAGRATNPILLFVDADVRLEPEGAARLAGGLLDSGADLISGVPRQIMKTTAERAVIPMINALILGYLPVAMMRRDPRASLAAGCGQMMMVRREAYDAAGGHGGIRTSLHDGIKLPRLFRAAGLRTDLVDGTGLASCRMYAGAGPLVRGLLKNATEGMARPAALPVWTLLLFLGHVLPWLMLGWALVAGHAVAAILAALAVALTLAAHMAQARRCGEPLASVALHPVGVAALLAIQWTALVRQWLGIRTEWRGRAYQAQN
jgi:hypothetical protein